ncbi:MAG: LEA type 2 family protein [Deltaproteobacteria bacterium]|nr:LEA type 2 family protein [Deltaproteobacteria bacterium]
MRLSDRTGPWAGWQDAGRRLASAVLLLAILSILAGCAAWSPRPPSVTLAGVEIVGVNLFEQHFLFRLRIQNPNDLEIPIRGLRFEVELNDREFAKGVSDKPVTVPRLGEAILEVRAVSSLAVVLGQIDGMLQGRREAMTYRVRGRLFTDPFGGLDFDEGGRIEFPGPPRTGD